MATEKKEAKRKFVTMAQFVEANLTSRTIAEVVEKTGLKPASVQQRRTHCRSKGIVLPEFARGGGGNRTDVNAALEQIAKLTGKTLEQVKAESAALLKKQAEKAAVEKAVSAS